MIPYKLGIHDNLFYLGNCHGPVGTTKLFYELYKATNEEQYLQEVFALIEGARALGAPFVQSAGFWNTIGLCCGPAGYFTGAAGIAVALLQIYCMRTENKGGLHLIDDPYEG
ncbi:MAG: hypothetical protein II919_03725 [Lachnospiraceae bacterium]|nr:hypothetical protein [Lachnospiraceae bacterium]